jgi:hypothetical protein
MGHQLASRMDAKHVLQAWNLLKPLVNMHTAANVKISWWAILGSNQ